MAQTKQRNLKKAWVEVNHNKLYKCSKYKETFTIYETDKIKVICSPTYEIGCDIGIYWKDYKKTKAFPLTFNTITPFRLSKELSLALLVGLKTLKHKNLTNNGKERLDDLIKIYEDEKRQE